MTPKEKINYMATASNICGFPFRLKEMDLFVSLYDLITEKQGDTDLKSISEVVAEHEKRFPPGEVLDNKTAQL
jgi:hypothetical protein